MRPSLIVVAGPNGSGKTTITEKLLRHEWMDNPSINAQRIALRVMEGGHDVPITKIIERYYRSIKNSVKAVALADRAYFYDNSVSDYDPKLLYRTADGKVIKIYNKLNPWAADIVDLLNQK